MIKRLYPATGTMLVYAFLLSICASLTMAESAAKTSAATERGRLNTIMAPGSEIEAFRQEYLNYLTELQDNMRLFITVPAVQQKLDRAGLKPIASLSEAIASVSEMSREDLTMVRGVYAKFPGWREMPEAMIQPELRAELQAKSGDRKDGLSKGITESRVADDCAAANTADHTTTDISISKGLQIALAASMEAFPTDGITIAGRLPAIAANAAGEVATLAIETLKNIKDDCRDDTFQADMTTKVTAIPGLITTSTTTTATNITTAKTEIIANDDANKTTIVNNDNANTVTILAAVEAAKTYIVTDAAANRDEMKNLLLRTQIEADLASTDGAVFVALYETPSTVCKTSLNSTGLPQTVSLPGFPTITIAQCGLLDLVRSIVRDTIANVGAGTNASDFYAVAEKQRAQGKYKAAYASYRQAYKAASK